MDKTIHILASSISTYDHETSYTPHNSYISYTPLVTLCVVAYNEERYIADLLGDIAMQTYPKNRIELILIDSNSSDNTKRYFEEYKATDKRRYKEACGVDCAESYERECMDECNESNEKECRSDRYARILICDNPSGNLAAGWNVALAEYTGDVIIRVDAHARIPGDFIESNVRVLAGGEYLCCGRRPSIIDNPDSWKETLLLAEQSTFGGSTANYRNSTKNAYVKSGFHMAFKREVFSKVGVFDERFIRTEDNEMNYRIRKSGFKIFYSPSIISYEYSRDTLYSLLKQKYDNGYAIMRAVKVCMREQIRLRDNWLIFHDMFSWFHIIPLLFLLAIIITSVLAIFGIPVFAELMWVAYCLCAVLATLSSVSRVKMRLGHLLLPFIFFLLHISYGLGSATGIFYRQPRSWLHS